MLTQKNTHGVPRWKIEQMIEKQRIPIDMALIIETCRRKLNILSTTSENSSFPVLETSNDLTLCQDIISGIAAPDDRSRTSSISSLTEAQPSSSSFAKCSTTEENSAPLSTSDMLNTQHQAKGNNLHEGCAASFQSEGSTAQPILDATLQALRPERLEGSSDEKGTVNNDESAVSHPETIHSKKPGLSVLKSYFPAIATKELADILEQCKGDVTW